MQKTKRRRQAVKILEPQAQLDRARKMALEAGSGILADLYEIHAQACERSATAPLGKRKNSNVPS